MRKAIGLVCVLLMTVALVGCAKPTAEEMRTVAAIPVALAMAGYKGDFRLGISADGEAGLKEAGYVRSAGTRFDAQGEMDPSAVTPEIQAAYAKVLKFLLEPESEPE